MSSTAPFPSRRQGAKRPGLILVLGFLAALSSALAAQEADERSRIDERPRIGLVLSGGGVRGCAHAGLLEGLEELRVPVDSVVGTSMGAVVGGFYAAGLTPREIQDGLAAVNWNDLFDDQPDYRELSPRRKAEARRTLDLELGWKAGGAAFPSGLLGGQKLDLIFRKETLAALGIDDFDQLPIPFRAIATDLNTGLPVVIGSGDLPTAMRASMSIPGVFAPVERDGKTLVDGGLAVNLPVDTARELGADVTLAVNVSSPLLDPEALDSVFGVLAQTFSLLGVQETKRQAANADVLLDPHLEEVSPMQYERCDELFEAGAVAARARSGELELYSLSETAWAEHLGQRARRQVEVSSLVASVRVEGARERHQQRIQRRIRTVPGTALDLDLIAEDLSRIHGLGEFEWVQVQFERRGGGLGVVYRVREKSWGPNIFRFGFFTTDDLEGNNSTDFLARFTRHRVNRRGAEWLLALQAGRTRRAFTEFYQPLDYAGRWFVAPSFEESRTLTDVFEDDRQVAVYSVATTLAGLDIGWVPGPAVEIRAGARWGQGEAEIEVGSTDLPFIEVDVAAVELTATVDRRDSAVIPRDGYAIQLGLYTSLPSFGADDRYDKVGARFEAYKSRGQHGFFTQLDGGASPGSELPVYDEFTLGGLGSLSGFSEGQLRGKSFAVGRFGYSYRFYQLPPTLGGAAYVFGWIEAGNVGDESRPREISDLILTATLALAVETRLGPLYLAYGVAEDDRQRLYAVLGKRF